MSRRKHDYGFDAMAIGMAIREAREALKITREKGAERLNISVRHLQAIETEKQPPSHELFIHILTEFKVSLDAVLFPEEGKSSARRRLDRLLDSLDDRSLSIVEATTKQILEVQADINNEQQQ